MEDLKIKINNNADEIVDLLGYLGVKALGFSGEKNYILVEMGVAFFVKLESNFLSSEAKETTLQELRDMVVLKRNDVGDATHVDQYGDKWICVSNVWYFYSGVGEWSGDCKNMMHRYDLKPIKEEVMKEFLNPEQNYSLVQCCVGKTPIPESWIEVPHGAEELTSDESKTLTFWKSEYESMNVGEGNFWVSSKSDDVLTFSEYSEHPYTTLWQRKKESLNDKIATAEVVRQEEKHSHYKKDVSHLKMIDPYRIADLYALHPCAEHIMKKSLCAGNRGHKDTLRDIQDIIDTAERWKQMIEEDSNEI